MKIAAVQLVSGTEVAANRGRAAHWVGEAARAGIGCDEEKPLSERVFETAEGFLAALEGEGRDDERGKLRARLLALVQMS